jgi:MFS family permease
MFVLLGLPGLGLAALARFTLREPRCNKFAQDITGRLPQLSGPRGEAPASPPSLHEVCVRLWGNTTFRHTLFGVAVFAFFNNGVLQWQPAFFIRSYGLQTGELGTWFALIYGFGSLVGTYLGGHLASRYAAHNERLQLRAVAVAAAGMGVLHSFVYLSRNLHLAFGLTGVMAIVANATSAPTLAMVQSLVPERMRAMSIALIFLFSNLIGMGLGPLAAGVLSDVFRSWVGVESLRYALLLLCPGFFWAGWHLWQGSKSVIGDLATLDANNPPATLEVVAVVVSSPTRLF